MVLKPCTVRKNSAMKVRANRALRELLMVNSDVCYELSADFNGEFDPGSELTLAARLTHASRARVCTT